jgi:uncharacterized protein (TIGR03083 family)
MDDDQLWKAIDRQRLRTVELLDSLDAGEWAHPSLCDGWTVRDVAAHLTLQQLTIGAILSGMLRHPGSVNRVIREMARDRAAATPFRLVRDIEATVGSRRHNVGLTPFETLVDIVVHGQDIAVPLGRTIDVPTETATTVGSQVWSYYETRKGRRKAAVFRAVPYDRHAFVATDADWRRGEGPEVRGPLLDLVLVLTGRPAGLARLTGPGVEPLAEALSLRRTGR